MILLDFPCLIFNGRLVGSSRCLAKVFNSAYAHLLLGETVKWKEVVVMCTMVVGAVLVVSVTPVSTEKKARALENKMG